MADSKTLQDTAASSGKPAGGCEWLALVAEKVKTLDYGVVQIVVHGGKVVQVERTEKHRFDPPKTS